MVRLFWLCILPSKREDSSWLLLTVDMAASSLAGKRLQILAISLAQYSSMSRNLLLSPKSRHLLTLLAPENANLVLQAGYVPLQISLCEQRVLDLTKVGLGFER